MKKDTLITHMGRHVEDQHGLVNPGIFRGSTVLHPSLADLEDSRAHRFDRVFYGRFGTPTTFAFEEAIAALEGGHRCVAVSSGMAAVSISLLAFLGAGDHVLVSDSVYNPTRAACDKLLAGLGVETTYYDPLIGAGIADLMRPATRVVFAESPGAHTFEVMDIPAIAAAAHDRDAVLILDNSWATPYLFPAIAHGADVSVLAATKYIVGHSDAMLGTITTASEAHFDAVKSAAVMLGNCPGPEDCFLGLRGLRTLAVRLRQHERNGLVVARWLQQRPEVARVMHPALPEDPGHALWQRDFSGASGLFGIVLDRSYPKAAVAALVDDLEYFGLGGSWGGYESLVLPFEPAAARTATTWREPSPTLRFHVGLEDPEDLIADLERGFARLGTAA